MQLLITEFNYPQVTLCSWQDLKVQLLPKWLAQWMLLFLGVCFLGVHLKMEEVFWAVGEDMPGLVNASFPSGYGSEVLKYNRITCILSSVYYFQLTSYPVPVDLLLCSSWPLSPQTLVVTSILSKSQIQRIKPSWHINGAHAWEDGIHLKGWRGWGRPLVQCYVGGGAGGGGGHCSVSWGVQEWTGIWGGGGGRGV